MIVEMGDYAWSGLEVDVVGTNETLHFRITTFWAQLLLGVGV
jgi:hypothetical protein